MVEQTKLTVALIVSPGHSGKTWLGLMLGAHPQVINVGEIKPAIGAKSLAQVCAVKESGYEFWKDFDETWDGQTNIFVHLQSITGKCLYVASGGPGVYNGLLIHPRIKVRFIKNIRDGRAVTASLLRKYSDDKYQKHVEHWVQATTSQDAWLEQFPAEDRLFSHYEDLVENTMRELQRICEFLGIEYLDEMRTGWWNVPQPILDGNAGTRSFMSKNLSEVIDPEFYRQKPPLGFIDERWKDELTIEDLENFESIAGEVNRRYGYSEVFNKRRPVQLLSGGRWIQFRSRVSNALRKWGN